MKNNLIIGLFFLIFIQNLFGQFGESHPCNATIKARENLGQKCREKSDGIFYKFINSLLLLFPKFILKNQHPQYIIQN